MRIPSFETTWAPAARSRSYRRRLVEIDRAADGVDGDLDLEPGRGALGQGVDEGVGGRPGFERVEEHVDVVLGGRDVLEDAREVAPAVEEDLDARGDGRGEGQGLVAPADPRQGEQHGGAVARRLRRDRLRPDGLASMADPAPSLSNRRAGGDRRSADRGHGSGPASRARRHQPAARRPADTSTGSSTAPGAWTGRTILLHRLVAPGRPARGSGSCPMLRDDDSP